ncbi:hypothetical protein [Vibrio splendidus]|uniref:hypothetical protein n=1 Tax=Vibrio splendidus TaxID=29497 RepID=UPI000C81B0E7|nr:hypothetical protein [Vibrio splendidus]PMI54366.1 hypothetical protein BCU42_18405 [Vibrio splendidus]
MSKLKPLDPNLVPDPLLLDSEINTQNRKENSKRIWVNRTKDKKAKLKFPGYDNKLNKNSIRDLYYGCCAYCGVKINSSQTETVEHFRPKAQLDFKLNYLTIDHINDNNRGDDNPYILLNDATCEYGYYRWGDDHLNLLPSCECCNTGQARNAICICPPRQNQDSGSVHRGLPYGKKMLFPIWLVEKNNDSRKNKRFVQNIDCEVPLLYNPYIDNYQDLFSYKEAVMANNAPNQIIKIRPKKGLNLKDKVKAMVSINLYGLNREYICTSRYNIHDELSSINDEFDELKDNNIDNIIRWATISKNVARHFSKGTEFMQFKVHLYKFLIEGIYHEVRERYPNSNGSMHFSTGNLDLFSKSEELSNFSSIIPPKKLPKLPK